jgi:RND family efflux transporter MFP subunit
MKALFRRHAASYRRASSSFPHPLFHETIQPPPAKTDQMKKSIERTFAAVFAVSALAAAGLALAALTVSCAPAKAAGKKALDLTSVSVAKPAFREVSDSFSIIGSVQASSEVTVLSETSGRIVEAPAKVGDAVKAGTPLVSVDKDLREAAYIAAEAAYRKASKDAERAAGLRADKVISDADIEQIRLAEASARAQYLVAKKELENTTVRATIGGTVAETYVGVGEQLAPGSRVALVVDGSRLKVRVLLPERSALAQRAGDRVAVESELFRGRPFEGRIESVGVRGDETHSFPVEVTLLGAAASELRAGMSVRLSFGGRGVRKALLIPRQAVVGGLRDPEVFVVEGGSAVLRKLSVGGEYGTDLEVLSGLAEGDPVVTGGQTLLSDGQQVKVVGAEAGHDAD